MIPDKDKDITQRMAEMLRKHSLPYKEGAWERFKDFEASKRKSVVLWPYLTGAAALILMTITLFFNNREEAVVGSNSVARSVVTTEEIQTQEIRPAEKPIVDLITQSNTAPVQKLARRESGTNSEFIGHNKSGDLTFGDPLSVASISQTTSQEEVLPMESILSDSKLEETVSLSISKTDAVAAKLPSSSIASNSVRSVESKSFYPNQAENSLQSLTNNEILEASDKLVSNSAEKWNFSLEVAPNIMENSVNFGGGVGVSYKLSKKLSISSGISYVQLSANRNPQQPAEVARTSLSTYNYSKSLSGVNTSLTGLDIPVNLKLNLNSNMYASAGISVFNVLNESRYNNFEERVAEMAYTADSSPGQKAPEPLVHTVYSQEASSEAPYQGKNFTGFFNLSIGYKLPFLEKLHLAIEPYVKIPVGSLSQQDMDLSNGGLKIITNF